ncbi:MAG TPA: PIN domain-containing protein [Chloroflexota bacterium]|nr:PIN domain-containing protein [Chloroflexota bacterium]
MKLAADASALVAESLRARGEHIIKHDDLDIYIAVPTWSEVEHELGRRLTLMVQQGRLEPVRRERVLAETLAALSNNLTIVTEAEYGQHEAEARDRIPQDPNDWPTIALALALGTSIWTADQDFFGCGVPVWTTQTLLLHLAVGRAS